MKFQILDIHKHEIESLCRKYGLRRLRVFGSLMTDSWDSRASDIDFLAEFGPVPSGLTLFKQHMGFCVEMEKLLLRPVDVVDASKASNSEFRQRVEKVAVEVYAA